MNHDAKSSGGIFSRRRPSSASTSSRLSIQQSNRSGSLSCPTSPRHSKHLPAINSISSTHLNDVLTTASTSHQDGQRHLHRSPSATTYNYRQNSNFSYTGPPSAPVSAHTSRVDLSNIGRPSTGSVIYLGKTNSSNSGSRLSLVSRSSSLSSPHSSPKHRPRQ